jgi:DNA-binding transcriptional regulator LsrR (DeoR family)
MKRSSRSCLAKQGPEAISREELSQMAKLRRAARTALSEAASLRLRAAWLYYNHGLTQKDVADQLGIGRTTVVGLLDEALKRGEIRIWIEEGEASCMALAIKLERALHLDEAIVVPAAKDVDQTAKSVGLALGKFLSEAVADDMTIGVGWGRTLTASLQSFRPARRRGVRVMSLLGGAVETRFVNPVEYAWRLASLLGAECHLFPAPLIVDSVETKQHLIEKCGLDRLFAIAQKLDIAVVSVGDIGPKASSLARHLVTEQDLDELTALGCVGDVMCNFLDRNGKSVAHAINQRVMSIDLETLRKAGHVVIACGGAHRAEAIAAVIKRIGCNTLVTDESAAEAILAITPAK